MSNNIVKDIDTKIDLMTAKSMLKRCASVLDNYTSDHGRNNDEVLQMINDVEIFLEGDL